VTAPRIPRHRPAVIPCRGARWHHSPANRVLAVVLLATFGGVALHALLALWAALP